MSLLPDYVPVCPLNYVMIDDVVALIQDLSWPTYTATFSFMEIFFHDCGDRRIQIGIYKDYSTSFPKASFLPGTFNLIKVPCVRI